MLGRRDLLRSLETVAVVPLVGPFHRYVLQKYILDAVKNGRPLHVFSGEYSLQDGGRFNYPNRHRTAYVARDETTARIEGERIPAPYVHFPIAGRLQRVLDLGDPAVTTKLQVSAGDLGADWRLLNDRGQESPTQRLGYAVYEFAQIEAIAFPSTVNPDGVCLAVLPSRLAPGSVLELQDPSDTVKERISG